MKATTLPLTLAAMLLVTPVFGQQPAPKPEMPPWNDAVFAYTATDETMHADTRFAYATVLSRSLEKRRQ